MDLNMYTPSVLNADPLILAIPAVLLITIIAGVIVYQKYSSLKKALFDAEELLATQKKLRTMLYSLPIPIRLVDIKSHKVVYVNESFLKMFELESPDDIIGKNIFSFVAGEQSDGVSQTEKIKRVYESDETKSTEVNYLLSNGKILDALLISCYMDYNGIPCSLGILKDLTAEKKSQKILINAVKKEKEEKKLKASILESLSHDIRSPMGMIISLTEIGLYKSLPQETLQTYKKINTSARNLLQIIDDAINLSNIESNKIELRYEEFELDEVLNNALLVVSHHLEGNENVKLLLNASLDLPRFLIGDKTRLWQILKGFLENSAKYTKSGKIVLSVSLDGDPANDALALITFMIKDTGSADSRKKILLPDESQTEYSSEVHSILASKRLCSLMGGELEIESEPDGALIRFTIPFRRSNNSETTKQAIETTLLSGLNILIVDDDELSLKIMERLLKCSNVNCVLARSGTEAIKIVSEYRDKGLDFDVILLDYMMDDINGLVTATKIRLSLFKAPKIIIVTAYKSQMMKDKIEKSYIDDIIEKPFAPSQFIQKVCAMVGARDVPDGLTEAMARYKDVCVLICEDNIINQEITAGMIEEFGVSHIIADNGAKCVEILNGGHKVDLILMDLYMPVMDGLEATRIIRANSNFDGIPIVSLTADTMPQIIEKCLEAGMNDHLAKPVEFEALNAMFIRQLPENKRVK